MDERYSQLKDELVNTKISIVENKSQISDLNSTVLRTMGQSNNNEVAIGKVQKMADQNTNNLNEMLIKQVNLERRVTHSMILSTILIIIIISLVLLTYINGMNVHYQTGLDEFQNEIFPEETN